ncbi:hypothetical protein [Nostoc sp. TCL26-01]|uniref:hypothetical protein n=1 Tax=Nostoc sp. TCL26-01 TaxID=2576904 RepID=UPI0015BC864D|nr:hypothetical protein [Nostoc sp. TCL26-01]QLE54782.1 hypothetical protein FD725_04205 [Nostoc sp. TCL26-01]
MSQQEQNKVLFVTGVRVAIDEEHRILIAGMLSNSPFVEDEQESSSTAHLINFAFTRQHAAFLRDRLDEFLKGEV